MLSSTAGSNDADDRRSENNDAYEDVEDEEEEEEEDDDGDRKPAAAGSADEPPRKKRRRKRVISTLQESKWQQMFQRLKVYADKHGNALVPNRYAEDTSLGAWVATQRRNYRVFMSESDEPSGMTAERVRQLEDIGFQWTTTDPRHEPWEVRYEELKAFVNKYGHAEIPMRWEENVQLSNWVSKQRQDYKLRLKGKSTRLTDERMKLLDDVGFKWHIPRKGRKIKQKSIPVIKRSPDGGLAQVQGQAQQVTFVGTDPPALAGSFSGVATAAEGMAFPFQQVTNPNSLHSQSVSPSTSADPPTLPAPGAAALPSPFLGLQSTANAGGIDLNSALGLQNALAALTGTGGVAALGGQPSAPAPAPPTVNIGAQGLLSGALGLPQPVQQNSQAPAAFLLPIQFGNVQGAAPQQHVLPVSMPWPSADPASGLGIQGLILGVPAAMAPPPASAASIATQALATQLLGALAAAPQIQQQQSAQQIQQQLLLNALSATNPATSVQRQPQPQQQVGGAANQSFAESLARLLAGRTLNQNQTSVPQPESLQDQQQQQQQPPPPPPPSAGEGM